MSAIELLRELVRKSRGAPVTLPPDTAEELLEILNQPSAGEPSTDPKVTPLRPRAPKDAPDVA